MFTTIGWNTKDVEYQNVMLNYLWMSLQKLDIPYKIYPMDAIGNWSKNTNLKSVVIQKAFEELNTDLFIVDADAVIHQYPTLLEEIPEEYDCAMFWLDWNEWYQNGSDVKELCSGTLYLRNRKKCRDLIDVWNGISQLNSNIPDQRNLQTAITAYNHDEKEEDKIKIYPLPYEYCWINSLPGQREPFVKKPKQVIVEHFQVSRTLKRSLSLCPKKKLR